jgi:biotin transport system substrate-specific component
MSKTAPFISQSASLRKPAPVVLADLIPGAVVRDILLVVGAVGFVGALAQISIHLSFTPVPTPARRPSQA